MRLHLHLGLDHTLAAIVPGLGEVGIGHAVAITIGPAGIPAIFPQIVDRFRWQIVAQPVASVDRDPDRVGLRIHGQPHRIAQAFREDFLAAAIGIELHHGSAPRIFFDADVAT